MVEHVSVQAAALALVWRNAWAKETLSNTKATPSTAYATVGLSTGPLWLSWVIPCQTETAAPATKSPMAANIDHT